MNASEAYHLLGRRARRGLIIFPILWLASVGIIIWAIATPGDYAWAITAILISIVIYIAYSHVRKAHYLARLISEKPQLVYWAQPNVFPEKFSPDMINCRFVTLHLRNGLQLEVHLAQIEMRKFAIWLTNENPTVRWGAYDV